MTIMRTLFFFSTIFFSYINAHDDIHNHIYQAYPYDVISPKATTVLNFAQTLSYPFSSVTHSMLAEWLMKGIADYSFDNITIIKLANIIESDATMHAKIAGLLAVQTTWNIELADRQRNNTIITGAFLVCFAAMVALVIKDIIAKNYSTQS
ncbi:MAG TPA: hypothetical protein VKU36_00755 [Candidatus Babeliales bacterium]|nr:hypothetical protein [Candidatus Babeliales bacterium]